MSNGKLKPSVPAVSKTLAIQESAKAAGFAVTSLGPDKGFDCVRGEGEGRESFVILPMVAGVYVAVSDTVTERIANLVTCTMRPAKMAQAGIDKVVATGWKVLLRNALIGEETDSARIEAVEDKAKALHAGTFREGGGGGSRLTVEERSQRQAITSLLGDVTLPKGVTTAKLASELDKALDTIARHYAAQPGTGNVAQCREQASAMVVKHTAELVALESASVATAALFAAPTESGS